MNTATRESICDLAEQRVDCCCIDSKRTHGAGRKVTMKGKVNSVHGD